MNMGAFYFATAACVLLANASPATAQTAPTPGVQPANVQTQAPARIGALFGALDTNKDKMLSPQEFQGGYALAQRMIAFDLRLQEQFRMVDADHSGAIEAGEYANLVLVKQKGTAAPELAAFDTNKNQKLEFSEYLAVVQRLAASQPATPAEKK